MNVHSSSTSARTSLTSLIVRSVSQLALYYSYGLDAKRESAFKVLPTVLPQSIYKNGGKVFRPTTTESWKSFIWCTTCGDQHGDAFQHILCLGDETATSHTFAIVLGHAIETDLLLEAVYLFQVLFLCLMLATLTSSFLGISPACSISYRWTWVFMCEVFERNSFFFCFFSGHL